MCPQVLGHVLFLLNARILYVFWCLVIGHLATKFLIGCFNLCVCVVQFHAIRCSSESGEPHKQFIDKSFNVPTLVLCRVILMCDDSDSHHISSIVPSGESPISV